MSITVHPVDGFITRLLQQHLRNSSGKKSESHSPEHDKSNNTSIPTETRDTTAEANQDSGKLESSLLGLYNSRDDG